MSYLKSQLKSSIYWYSIFQSPRRRPEKSGGRLRSFEAPSKTDFKRELVEAPLASAAAFAGLKIAPGVREAAASNLGAPGLGATGGLVAAPCLEASSGLLSLSSAGLEKATVG